MKFTFLLLIFVVSCQDLNSNSSDRTRYSAGAPVGSLKFQAAYPIINNRCANCHTSTIHNKWSAFTNEADWENESTVVPGNSDASSFITRMQNYDNQGDMPQASSAIPDEEYDILVDWVDSL